MGIHKLALRISSHQKMFATSSAGSQIKNVEHFSPILLISDIHIRVSKFCVSFTYQQLRYIVNYHLICRFCLYVLFCRELGNQTAHVHVQFIILVLMQFYSRYRILKGSENIASNTVLKFLHTLIR